MPKKSQIISKPFKPRTVCKGSAWIVEEWYGGRLQKCLKTKRIIGYSEPRGSYLDMMTGWLIYAQGPYEPKYSFDLIPLEDNRPHWLTTPQRKPSRFGKPARATGRNRLRYVF